MTEKPKLQIDKFRDAARELGTDEDPERFAEKVRKLAKAKPMPHDPKSAVTSGRQAKRLKDNSSW